MNFYKSILVIIFYYVGLESVHDNDDLMGSLSDNTLLQ